MFPFRPPAWGLGRRLAFASGRLSLRVLPLAFSAPQDVAKVNAFFRNFDQTVSIHRWVQRRSSEDLPIPKTMDEFLRMSSTDSKGLSGMQGAKQGKGRGRLGMTSQLGW